MASTSLEVPTWYPCMSPEPQATIRAGVSLHTTNWFQVGGQAEWLFRPRTVEALALVLRHRPEACAVTVLGVGSNVIIRDGGISGLVVRLGKGFRNIHYDPSTSLLHAGAGALSAQVAHFAATHGLGGLSFLVGIPGTIGGALAMNAGAYGGEVAAILAYAEAVDWSGSLHTYPVEQMKYRYRSHGLSRGVVFTQAMFHVKPSNPADLTHEMSQISSQREATQPIHTRTTGSLFRNPGGAEKAWELIDRAGCRGLQYGGAMISTKHANFMINYDHATAQELEQLGLNVQEQVYRQTGVRLEWEVERLGMASSTL